MKTIGERMALRLRKDRPTTTLSIRLPEDVVEDLTEIAPTLGFSGPLPLMRAYIGRGLRDDLFRLQNSPLHAMTESLRKQGVTDEQISAAIAALEQKPA